MYVREYDIIRMAFDNSFAFMLNRIADTYNVDLSNKSVFDRAMDLCFNEFMVAFEEMGAKFGEDE